VLLSTCYDSTGLRRDEDHIRSLHLDTAYQFSETLELRAYLQERYDMCLRLGNAPATIEPMEARFGSPIYANNPDHCCYLRQVMSLQTAVQGCNA
jgi:phosphoadenosine phosphosulfate reductase